jgi:hypothetical protein
MLLVLLNILAWLLILVVIFYIVKLAVDYFQGPHIVLQIFGLILLLVFLVIVLSLLGVGGPLVGGGGGKGWRLFP